MRNHVWMTEVMKDLTVYSRMNGLPCQVVKILETASVELGAQLSEAIKDGSFDSEPGLGPLKGPEPNWNSNTSVVQYFGRKGDI